MPKKGLMMLSLSSLAFISCTIKVPDLEVCLDKGNRAVCKTTVSAKTRVPQYWEAERIGKFCISPKDFGEVKKFILKACEKTECEYERTKSTLEDLENLK